MSDSSIEDGNNSNNNQDFITTTDDVGGVPLPPLENKSRFYPGSDFDPKKQQQKTWAISLSRGRRSPTSLRDFKEIQDRIVNAAVREAVRTTGKPVPQQLQRVASQRIMGTFPINNTEAYLLTDPYYPKHKVQFENCLRVDGTIIQCLNVLAKFTLGKRTHFHIASGMEELERQAFNQYRLRMKPPKSADIPAGAASFGPRPSASESSPETRMTATGALQPPLLTTNYTVDGRMPPVPTLDKTMDMMDAAQDEQGVPQNSRLSNILKKIESELDVNPMTEQEMRSLHRFIGMVNARVRFHEKMYATSYQARGYGRGAVRVLTDNDGVPAELELLNSKKMGQLYADPVTKKLLGVEYSDNSVSGVIPMEDLIYLPYRDYHLSPDTQGYGYSILEPVVHISETNQLLNEVDLKEAARSIWAGSGVIKFPPDTSADIVDEFVENFYAGTWNATSQNVTIETYNLKLDYIALTNARKENRETIIAEMGVPSFLAGFENISNRSTAASVMVGWEESSLNFERVWLQDQLEPQWFDYLVELAGFGDLVWSKSDVTKPLTAKSVRVMLDFKNISLDPWAERMQAILPAWDRGLMPVEKYTEVLGIEDFTPEILAEQERRHEEADQRFQVELDLKQKRVDAYRLMSGKENVAGANNLSGNDTADQQREQNQQQKQVTASLNSQQALLAALTQQMHQNESNTKLEELKLKWAEESHKADMDLRMQKKQMIDELSKAIIRMQDAAN